MSTVHSSIDHQFLICWLWCQLSTARRRVDDAFHYWSGPAAAFQEVAASPWIVGFSATSEGRQRVTHVGSRTRTWRSGFASALIAHGMTWTLPVLGVVTWVLPGRGDG